jgi:hypothetical protein
MANRLTKLQVDEVSVVDKAANNKRFLILKQANHDSPEDSESIRKTGRPSLFGRGRKEPAGTPGPTDGGIDMITPEDVRKAVAEAGAEILAPLEERITALETASVTKALPFDDEEIEPTAEVEEVPDEEEVIEDAAPEPLTPEAVGEMITEALAPFAARLDAIESATGVRKSGLEEQGAHTVRKADGSFSWEGSGLLL